MTPSEAVLMDLLLERGYTREQAARALVALTLPEPRVGQTHLVVSADAMAASLTYEAERRGYPSKDTAPTPQNVEAAIDARWRGAGAY